MHTNAVSSKHTWIFKRFNYYLTSFILIEIIRVKACKLNRTKGKPAPDLCTQGHTELLWVVQIKVFLWVVLLLENAFHFINFTLVNWWWQLHWCIVSLLSLSALIDNRSFFLCCCDGCLAFFLGRINHSLCRIIDLLLICFHFLVSRSA